MRPQDLLRARSDIRIAGEGWGELRPTLSRLHARERDIAELIREPRLTAGVRAGSREVSVRNTTRLAAIGKCAPLLMRLMRKKTTLVRVSMVRESLREGRAAWPKVDRSDMELRAAFADRARAVFSDPIAPLVRRPSLYGMKAAAGIGPLAAAGEGA